MRKRVGCYIYTRVSTAVQVEGFSLDAQREKLRKYADYQDMTIVREYSDEGKSGKNVDGRPQFQQMLRDIEEEKDGVAFVLVFKLSRFGRNAADVLSSLQHMQDFGVNLICVEDGIDSSKDAGKLMISVLSAVAEIERENILIQTMEGRRQKAREGRWNGGFAPYGYALVNGALVIAEDEADVIRTIYDKYIHTSMGISKIADWLNKHDYVKKKRQNNSLDAFSASFVKSVLDNPVYCGKVAYGRRQNERIQGTRNQYHVVKQQAYPVYEGQHESIVSEEDWQLAQAKRRQTGNKWEKKYSLEHEHLLSGILRCPVCGAGMYGNVNRKRKKDGSGHYKDYFYYKCIHASKIDGHPCDYKKQWKQDTINAAVEEVIHRLVREPQFEQALREKIDSQIDIEELEQQLQSLRKALQQLENAKNRLSRQMDHLDCEDPMFDRKYLDLQTRQDKIYEEIGITEQSISDTMQRIENVRRDKLTSDTICQYLIHFDEIYDKSSDAEKKEFLNSLLESVEIYPEQQPDGRILKEITFRFPIYYDDGESGSGSNESGHHGWKSETTVSTVLTENNEIS